MQIDIPTLVFTLAATFAWVIIGYHYYAKGKGWWVSKLFISDTSPIKLFAYLALPGAAVSSGFLSVWWSPVFVIVVGLILAFILTNIFRSFIQDIATLGVIVCWVLGTYLLFNP